MRWPAVPIVRGMPVPFLGSANRQASARRGRLESFSTFVGVAGYSDRPFRRSTWQKEMAMDDKPLEILPWGMTREQWERKERNRAAAHRGIKITLWMGAALAAVMWYAALTVGG